VAYLAGNVFFFVWPQKVGFLLDLVENSSVKLGLKKCGFVIYRVATTLNHNLFHFNRTWFLERFWQGDVRTLGRCNVINREDNGMRQWRQLWSPSSTALLLHISSLVEGVWHIHVYEGQRYQIAHLQSSREVVCLLGACHMRAATIAKLRQCKTGDNLTDKLVGALRGWSSRHFGDLGREGTLKPLMRS